MKSTTLPERGALSIREATAADAAAAIALFQQIYAETSFMLFEPGEFVPQAKTYAARIADTARREDGVMFLAESEAGPVGALFGMRGTARKTRHSLYLVIGILRSHWHQGIGRSLLQAAQDWATVRGMHRLDLSVQTTNTRAVALYERAGFEREGLKRHSLWMGDGKFGDEWLMSKLLGAETKLDHTNIS